MPKKSPAIAPVRSGCTVCNHPDRASIDTALVAGKPSQRQLSEQIGIRQQVLSEHYRRCVQPALTQSHTSDLVETFHKRNHAVWDALERNLKRAEELAEKSPESAAAVTAPATYLSIAQRHTDNLARAAGLGNDKPLSIEGTHVTNVIVLPGAHWAAPTAAGSGLPRLSSGDAEDVVDAEVIES